MSQRTLSGPIEGFLVVSITVTKLNNSKMNEVNEENKRHSRENKNINRQT